MPPVTRLLDGTAFFDGLNKVMKPAKQQKPSATIRFDAELLRPNTAGASGACASITLPEQASAQLPARGATMVEGTINGFPFRAALEPDGNGNLRLRMDKALQAAADADAGDIVAVEIIRAGEETEIRMPLDWQKALAAAPRAHATWAATTPAARRDWILWICSGKLPETRQIRIEKGCDMLAKGKKRVCCFGGLGWLRKDHKTAGENWLPLPARSRAD